MFHSFSPSRGRCQRFRAQCSSTECLQQLALLLWVFVLDVGSEATLLMCTTSRSVWLQPPPGFRVTGLRTTGGRAGASACSTMRRGACWGSCGASTKSFTKPLSRMVIHRIRSLVPSLAPSRVAYHLGHSAEGWPLHLLKSSRCQAVRSPAGRARGRSYGRAGQPLLGNARGADDTGSRPSPSAR